VSIVAISLGSISRDEAASVISSEFDSTDMVWLDRNDLRRNAWTFLIRIARTRHDDAVLVASDLQQPRLRLTSWLLALPRARRRWRMDLHGNREAWRPQTHLRQHAWPVARHAIACAVALIVAEPMLRLVLRVIDAERRNISCTPKRLLYLRPQLWLGLQGGGSVAHTAGVVGGLEQLGVDVHAVSSDTLSGVSAPTTVVRPEIWFDGWLRELEDLAYNLAFAWHALNVARRFKPDAIYQRHTAFNVSGAVLARILCVPLILEFNSSELWKGRYWGGLRLVRAAELVERINVQAADRVVVVSRVLRDELVRSGLPAAKIVVNPNAVDPDQFRPDVDGARVRERFDLNSSVVVGFSGTFGAWHGIPTLSEVIPRVLEERSNVRWLLIGDGPLRWLIERAIASRADARRVTLAGMVPHADMPAYLAACDILVSPHGRQADGGEFFGSPTKLFEYMAAGRPIVASAVGQIAEVLDDDCSALLVPPDDSDALTEVILRLVDSTCLRARLGAAARVSAEQRHTWRQNAQRVLACLQPSQPW
jgi:glycosyltransferase involved in cell wall biosynthesis